MLCDMYVNPRYILFSNFDGNFYHIFFNNNLIPRVNRYHFVIFFSLKSDVFQLIYILAWYIKSILQFLHFKSDMYKVAKSALLDVLSVRIMLWVVVCVLHWFYLSFHLGCSVQGQCTSFSIFNSSCTVVDSAVVSAPKITHLGEQIHCRASVALTSLPKIAMQRIVVCIHVSSVLQFDLASGSSICCMASCLIWRSLRACSLISPVLSAQSNNLC